MSFSWSFPAYNMASRTDRFRLDFLRNYWQPVPRPPYPLAQQLRDSTIRPSDRDAWDLLMERQSAPFEGDTIVSRGPEVLAPFEVFAAGQTLRLDVMVPVELRVQVAVAAEEISFAIDSGLDIDLHQVPVGANGAPLPIGNRQRLMGAKVGVQEIEYELVDVETESPWNISLQLKPKSLLEKAFSFLANGTRDSSCLSGTVAGGGCTLCSCPGYRPDFEANDERCINVQTDVAHYPQLCGHGRQDHR